MTDPLPIVPALRPVRGSIRPPGSKSITNRALVCAALAEGTSHLVNPLESEDTQVMTECLQSLGIDIEQDTASGTLAVTGCGGTIPASESKLFVGNSGTTARFLTAMVSLGHGKYRLDGVARMHQRPIADLTDALSKLGVEIQCESPGGCPPVIIDASGLRGGKTSLRGNLSSQYLSGLLMAAPYADTDVEIAIEGPLVSRPYVDMTIEVMKQFGVSVTASDKSTFQIAAAQQYTAQSYAIEPDASAASYFWAAAAITGGDVTVLGLSQQSLQGDVDFCRCLEQMGCSVTYHADRIQVQGAPLKGIDVDMGDISDTAQTLATVALFAEGPTRIRGIAHNRVKETDRIGNLATQLRRLGATVAEFEDGLGIEPGPLRPAVIQTYDDHRMAMALSLSGLKQPGVQIENPGCTAKTYPDFFTEMAQFVSGASDNPSAN